MTDNFVAGLVSGLVVTVLVIIFRSIWLKIIVPWFEDRVYKDAHIEGTWFSLYPTLVELREEAITLQRRGHAVTGTMVCVAGGHDEGLQYKVRGSFRNMLLPLVYESKDKAKTDRGSLTLRLVRNANRMEGKIALYHSDTDTVDSWHVVWFRAKDDLERYKKIIISKKEAIDRSRRLEKEASEARRSVEQEERSLDSEKKLLLSPPEKIANAAQESPSED